MASLHELHRTLFPTARPVGATRLSAEQGARQVGWVRLLPGGGLPVEVKLPHQLVAAGGN